MQFMPTEGIVQGYHTVNSHGVLDMFWMMLILLVVILGVWSIINRVKNV